MARLIISLFLLTYAWSNLANAMEAFAHLAESPHTSHELHKQMHHAAHDASSEPLQNDTAVTQQDIDQQMEDHAHHHCAHNLVGMVFSVPTMQPADAKTLRIAIPDNQYCFELQQRLLRPPRD